MNALNIAARVLVILVGIAILGGVPPFRGLGSPLQEVFGSVVILFGALRLLTYFTGRRHEED